MSRQHWWQERVVYQIYPRSFQDSNGDGIGDLPGICQHLDDLAELGIGIIWLCPVFGSPNVDLGYDVSDYRSVNPEYGTLADLRQLIFAAGQRDIKVILDLVINHTSTAHDWFQRSRRGEDPYTDYYIWRPARPDRADRLPNNWTSFFGGPCWTFDDIRGEYYLHLFSSAQPDLNYHNPAVLAEVMAIMRYWLDQGIAGFRCDVINLLSKTSLNDGRRQLILTGREHYLSTPGTHAVLRQLRREVLDHYDCFTVGETVFVTPAAGQALCAAGRRELDMIFTFEHMECDQILVKWFKRRFDPARFGRVEASWQTALDWNANYLENHDQPRSVSRFGNAGRYWQASARMLAVLLLTLRGTPFIYQGQEIGMINFPFSSLDQIRDIESLQVEALARRLHLPAWFRRWMIRTTSRDNARTPMQWDASPQAGFTTGTPWLAVHPDYPRINVAAQRPDPRSIRSLYRELIDLRAATPVLLEGTFRLLAATRHIFAFERALGPDRLTIILNWNQRPHRVGKILRPLVGQPVLLTSSGSGSGSRSGASPAAPPAFRGTLAPYEAVIVISGGGTA